MTSDERKAAILDRLADFVLAEGLAAASLRPLGKAAQVGDRMLLYYFRDKAEVIAATLDRISQRLVGLLDARATHTPLPFATLAQDLSTLLMADEIWPYMCLWLELAGQAARGNPLYRTVGERIGRGFLAWGASQLDSPTPEVDAARLLVLIEGIVLLKSIGMEDVGRTALTAARALP